MGGVFCITVDHHRFLRLPNYRDSPWRDVGDDVLVESKCAALVGGEVVLPVVLQVLKDREAEAAKSAEAVAAYPPTAPACLRGLCSGHAVG